MSDETGEKHYDPTPSRIERAKREGNVARSQDAVMVAAFAAAIAATIAVLPALSATFGTAIEQAAENRIPAATYLNAVCVALLPLLCAGIAAIACAALQSGGVFFVAPAPKFERLSPGEGAKRMFSRDAVITGARAVVAFGAAAVAVLPSISSVMSAALRSNAFSTSLAAAWNGAQRTAITACAIGACFAAIDYGIVRAAWRKKLRMSFEDLKRDLKENDGDPQTRARRRSLHRSLSNSAVARVKDAAFVVTNPTHIAIALEYAPPAVPVPRVLVRAADDAAFKVRELARARGVPCVENIPLARALYVTSKPGDVVPQEQYIAVAEIVAALTKAGVLS